MPSATYGLFRRAILARKLIVCRYRGRRREVAPHVLGFKNRTERALVFQFGGETGTALPPGGDWRCFALEDVEDATMQGGAWRTGTSHRAAQTCVDIVDVDVNVPATLR
jgi:hypothetical protein